MYEVLIRRRAAQQLDGVPFRDHERILNRILALEENPRPHGCEKIVGDIYRIRVGPWRVMYMLETAFRNHRGRKTTNNQQKGGITI